MAFAYQVSYLLSVICYPLSVTSYLLSPICYLLSFVDSISSRPAVHSFRRFIAKGQTGPSGVIPGHRRQRLCLAPKRTAEAVFLFQYPVQPLGAGVFVTVQFPGHACRKPAGREFFNIPARAVLAAPV
jgi:hypothetical protein